MIVIHFLWIARKSKKIKKINNIMKLMIIKYKFLLINISRIYIMIKNYDARFNLL